MEHFVKAIKIEEILNHSEKEPVLVFKHSITCPISAGAHSRIVEGLEEDLIPYPIYIVIVQNDRELSNEIAKTLEVKHESPQLILIKEGKAIYDTSHQNILVEDIPLLGGRTAK